jgi:DNA-binding transcriptional MerR regulator
MAPPVEKSPEAFRTISEVADWLGVPAHVLRFWESKFPQVKPVKRAGGRRYFRPADMRLLGRIRILLHEDGMTIKALQKKLADEGTDGVAALSPSIGGAGDPAEAGDGGQVVRFARPGEDESAPEAHAADADSAADPSAEADPEPAAPEDAPAQPTDDEEAEHLAARHEDAPERPDGALAAAPSKDTTPAAPSGAEPEPPDPEPQAAKAPALPPLPDLPPDPPDDMQVAPGPVSRLAALGAPVSSAQAAQLSTLAERLRQAGAAGA